MLRAPAHLHHFAREGGDLLRGDVTRRPLRLELARAVLQQVPVPPGVQLALLGGRQTVVLTARDVHDDVTLGQHALARVIGEGLQECGQAAVLLAALLTAKVRLIAQPQPPVVASPEGVHSPALGHQHAVMGGGHHLHHPAQEAPVRQLEGGGADNAHLVDVLALFVRQAALAEVVGAPREDQPGGLFDREVRGT